MDFSNRILAFITLVSLHTINVFSGSNSGNSEKVWCSTLPSGLLTSSLQVVLYKGSFINGKYYGRGILYDASSGRVLEAGEFRNGVLTIPERMEEIDDENAYIERQESIP